MLFIFGAISLKLYHKVGILDIHRVLLFLFLLRSTD